MKVKQANQVPPKCSNCDMVDDPKRTMVRTFSNNLRWEKTICPNNDCSITGAYEITSQTADES